MPEKSSAFAKAMADKEGKPWVRPVIEEIVVESEPAKAEPKPTKTEPEPKAPPVESASPPPDMPIKVESGSRWGLFLIVLVIAFSVVVFAGGLYVYFNGIGNLRGKATPTLEASAVPVESPSTSSGPIASPSATPKAAVLSSYKVSILNGSGKIGVASKARAMVEKAGFKVTNVGNAASFDFTNTVIQAKDSVPESVVLELKTALTSGYTVEIGDPLASGTYDLVITVGSK